MPRKARVFSTTSELLAEVASKRAKLEGWFDARIPSLRQIVDSAVGSNTYRGITGFDPGPKHVFTGWASRQLNNPNFQQHIVAILGQADFDVWLESFADDLRQYWPSTQRTRKKIEYGQSRKLTNLLMKAFVLWDELDDRPRLQLISYLHSPLDEYVLKGIKECSAEFSHYPVTIPDNPTMSSVRNSVMYNNIQFILREIAAKAGLAPIHLDIFFWNLNHLDADER